MDKFRWFIQKSGIQFKQHQFDGVKWALHNETRDDLKCHGGFIADEMGLGKTITTIGLLISNFKFRTLIVLPNMLIQQWVHEIYRTTGHKPLVFYGPAKKIITIEELNKAPIVITSYATIAVNPKNLETRSLLHQVKWNRVIFDEAHHLRNKNSRYMGAKILASPIKWLISGTPIQNKRKDLLNLCSIIGLPANYCADPSNMKELLENHMLRRTKAQVGIQLPDLLLGCNNVAWNTESERLLSEDIHNAILYASAMDRLRLYIQARQACILPSMLKDKITHLVDSQLIPRDHNHSTALNCSSKLDAVIQTLLSRQGNGNGKLVFCHFREEIDTIVFRLRENGVQNVAPFDGRTRTRSKTLQACHEILVLQIQTGCEGLNLQADYCEVYFVSPNWNPAVEEQAIARCHRIGQHKQVHVFRFHMTTFQVCEPESEQVPTPSLDKYIHLVQETKREISNEILA